MAKNPGRLISTGLLVARQLCTAAEAAGKQDGLYKRLSAPGARRGSVEKTLNDFISRGRIKKFHLNSCITQLRKHRRFDRALEVMEWMEKRKMNFAHGDYARRLDLIGKAKGIVAAENYFNSLPSSAQNGSTYGALLNCYCMELMSEKAHALFEKMDKMKLLSNSLPFNNLMCLNMRLDQPEKVPLIVQEMKQKGVSPCTTTYNILLQSYGCVNDFEGVEKVLNEIKKDGEEHFPWTTYRNLAAAYVKAGLFEKAESALGKFEEQIEHTPAHDVGREAYHYLISLYAGISNLGAVSRVWNSLKSRFFITTNISYLTMLHALAKLKDVEGLLKCFKEWESSSARYDMRLANVVIRACLEQDLYEEAASIFNDALERTEGLFFNAREMFMVYFLKNHQLGLALKHLKAAFSEVKNNEWQPHQKTVSAFFDYFEEEKDVDGAEKLCQILKKINHLDSDACNLLVNTYMAAGIPVPEILQRLAKFDIEINPEFEKEFSSRVPPKQE